MDQEITLRYNKGDTLGKFTDKFKNAFNGGMDDDYEDFDDDIYDADVIDEDDLDEPEERRGFFGKRAQSEEKESKEPASRSSNPFSSRPSRNTPGRSNSRGNEVCIFKPSSIEDSREITETLLQGKAVVVNFE